MTIFFTSDQHFGHTNIIKHCNRPFQNTFMMNETIIAKHNERISPNDDVYHIGDFMFGNSEKSAIQFIRRLNGRHFLVPGNHDKCHSVHKNHARNIRRYEDCGFIVLEERLFLDLEGLGRTMLCHFPLREDSSNTLRYEEQRPRSLESANLLLHGHVHNSIEQMFPKMINVGVDVWDFFPVSLEEIVGLVSKF